MAISKALSCPFKLPPLDGRKFEQVKPNTDFKSPAAPRETRAASKPASFKQALADATRATGNAASGRGVHTAEEAGREIEAFLLSYIFKQAFSNSISSGLFGDSYASKMYVDMFIDAAAEEAAKSTPLGIADMIVSDINRERQTEEETANETQKLL